MTCAHIETTFRVTDNIELQILIIKVIVYGICSQAKLGSLLSSITF